MLKKVLIVALVVVTLLGSGFFVSQTVLAQSADLRSDEFMFDLNAITHDDIKEQDWSKKGIGFVIERTITVMAATIGSAAVLMMVVGGFMMLISAGRQEMYDKGKNYILKSVIGLAFVLGAYILVTTIQLLINSLSKSL